MTQTSTHTRSRIVSAVLALATTACGAKIFTNLVPLCQGRDATPGTDYCDALLAELQPG